MIDINKLDELLDGLPDDQKAIALKWAVIKSDTLKADFILMLEHETNLMRLLYGNGGDK